MIGGIGRRVLIQRAQDYTLRYQPQLIGITGSWGLALTKQAMAVALRDYTTLRIGKDGAFGPTDTALDIIGSRQPGRSWVELLGLGRIQEAANTEPKTIAVEVPARRPGYVDMAARKLPLSIAVVTNVHTSNLAYFRTKELAAHELLSLPASLPADAVAVMNLDEPLLAAAVDNLQARIIGYGHTPAADIQIRRLELLPGGDCIIELKAANQFFEGRLPNITTRMQGHAAVGGIAAAFAVTGDPKTMKEGLSALQSWTLPTGYGAVQELGGITVLADVFDATPESMEADVHALGRFFGRKIAIVGDTSDIGSEIATWYLHIGEYVAEHADVAIFVGPQMRAAQAAALKSEHTIDAHHFTSSRDVGKWLGNYVHSGDTILIAGAHQMRMNAVLSFLKNML